MTRRGLDGDASAARATLEAIETAPSKAKGADELSIGEKLDLLDTVE